mmetsp:Transcript_24876/g.40951  ORF Transcript_24876/g.40951 Transcript_24876/m.40951 type:complete len:149 (+) Transcript_24876:676-1122(+)
MTREGNRQELLKGPLIYTVMLIVCTVFFWRESPVGVIALMVLCGGDGAADIVGRRWGYTGHFPFNRYKSVVGSVAMFVTGFLFSVGSVYVLSALGHLEGSLGFSAANVLNILYISAVATAVEALPSDLIDDNISVPLAAIATGLMLFR